MILIMLAVTTTLEDHELMIRRRFPRQWAGPPAMKPVVPVDPSWEEGAPVHQEPMDPLDQQV